MRKKTFSEVCAKLFSTIFDKNGINYKLIGNRMLVRSASKKMLIDFNDMTVNFDTNDQLRMKKFVKVSYNNMMEMRRRYEDKLVALAKFINNDDYIDLRNSRQDLRSSRTDLRNSRKDLRKQARHDVENRESAILYIDGEFYEDLSHANCLAQYNKAHNVDKEKRTNQRKDNFSEIAEEDHKIAFAHKTNEQTTVDDFMNDADPTDHIFIEEKTLVNMTLAEAAEAFKKQYPDIPIYNDDTNDEEFPSEYEKLAKRRRDFRKMANRMDLRNKRKDLRKQATHDNYNRECAILYINGEFYEGASHADCLTAYKEAHNEKSNQDNISRRKNFNDDTLNNNKIAFAHEVFDNYSEDDFDNYVEKEKFIFLERDSLSNITMDEAVAAFKKQYPGIRIFDDDSNDDEEAYPAQYEQLASKRKDFRKVARRDLRKQADHDVDSRDQAVLYVDGQVFFGETHGECMNEYLSSKDKSLYNTFDRFPTVMRPDLLDRDSITEDNYDDEEEYQEDKDMLTVYDNAKEYAFAHLVGDEIYIEENSLYNLSINEAAKKIKDVLGDGYKYYNDDRSDKNDETGYKRLGYLS